MLVVATRVRVASTPGNPEVCVDHFSNHRLVGMSRELPNGNENQNRGEKPNRDITDSSGRVVGDLIRDLVSGAAWGLSGGEGQGVLSGALSVILLELRPMPVRERCPGSCPVSLRDVVRSTRASVSDWRPFWF